MQLNINQLKELDQRAKSQQFTKEDYELIKTLVGSYRELVNLIKHPDSRLDELREELRSNEKGITTDAAGSECMGLRPETRTNTEGETPG